MEVFLMLNGFELIESVDEQERTIVAVASGRMSREPFTEWLVSRVRPVE
jgi:death on curing protein